VSIVRTADIGASANELRWCQWFPLGLTHIRPHIFFGENMTRHFEFVGDDAQRHTVSEKFWEVTVTGTDVTVHFGRIGAAKGQTTEKSFASNAEAQAHADKLVGEKTKKGYVEK
jgi:predicted DNA-binding WGR domain protein